MLQHRPTPQWPFWLIAILAPLVFYATEHSVLTSQADAFTQSADEMLATAEGGNLLRRTAYPAFGMAGLLLICWPSLRSFDYAVPLILSLMFLTLWCCFTFVWSIDPGMTARRLLVLSCVLLAAWGTAKHLSLTQLLWITFAANLAFLIIGFASEVMLGTFRPWAGDHRFSGTLHPNSQGMNLAALCFSSVCLAKIRPNLRILFWTTFAVGLVFLYLTKSRTSFLGMLLSLGVIWSMRVPSIYKLATICVGLWTVSFLGVVLLLAGADVGQSASDAALMGREEQAESLTGRLPLWTELSGYAEARFFQGYGYDSFWTPTHIDAVSSELGWGLREAHNSYLDAVLGIGIIGLLLAMCAGAAGLWGASTAAVTTKHPGYAFLVALIFFGGLNAFTESSMVIVSFYTYLLACGLAHLALRPVEIVPASHQPLV